MSETGDKPTPNGGAGPESMSAGAMLRAARDKRGLHIAALAAAIKVSPRKLEALEADRHGELPDMTFTRALALAVCRALKIDAEPVLAKLPQAGGLSKLSQVGGGLNAPFREAPGSRDPGEFTLLRRPVFWATLVVLLGAVALAFLPERWMPWRGSAGGPVGKLSPASPVSVASVPAAVPAPIVVPAASAETGVDAASSVMAPASSLVETVHSMPPPAPGAVATAADAPAGALSVRTSGESWVEVQDGRGQMLLSRTVQPGEVVGLDGALPLRLTIGNAAATQVVFRGQPVDLVASTRDNVARLQLR